MLYRVAGGTQWLIRLIDLIPEETFLVIALIWLLHVKFSSIDTPRDLPPCLTFLQFVSLVQLYTRNALIPLDFFHGLWRNHCKQVYHFTGSKPVFQPKRKFSFARLLRSLRSDSEDVKCKSNIIWFLESKSFVTHWWIKIISVSHFSPASRPLRSPASRPSLSHLPYPSRPYSPGLPSPCPPPPPTDKFGL